LNTNESINKNDNTNEIFIDVITNLVNNNNNEKQLLDTTLSSASPTSSVSSEKNLSETNEKLITNTNNNNSKTECNSQHLVYQNETTSSSSSSSASITTSSSSSSSSSTVELTSIKYENIDKNEKYSSSFIQNDYAEQQHQVQQLQEDHDETTIYLENTGNKRTSNLIIISSRNY